VDCERVRAAVQLGGERGIDHAVALQAPLPPERLRYNIQAEMALAARPVAGMAFVLVGFVDHPDAFRSESFGQLSCDEVGKPHARFAIICQPDEVCDRHTPSANVLRHKFRSTF
jgi:hypothetical protein